MEFHIARKARERYQFAESLFSYNGNVILGSLAACREFAHRMNQVRDVAKHPEQAVHAGQLFAMGLIDEAGHVLMARYREQFDPQVMTAALDWFGAQVGADNLDKMLLTFVEQFPGQSVMRGQETPAQWLAGETGGMPHRAAALEELLLLWTANRNEAFKPFEELFEEKTLAEKTVYRQVTAQMPDYFASRPLIPLAGARPVSLLELLRAPALRSPKSLSDQLELIRQLWKPLLGDILDRFLVMASEVLREEELAVWAQFNPPGTRQGPQQWPSPAGSAEVVNFSDSLHEYERFSQDTAWMPEAVLIAKSTYVWLAQLSRWYGRHIGRLDEIPEEELATLAAHGINSLWLIGVWERSRASKTIKQLCGNKDAVASAYSLFDYRIADDLGGEAAYIHLRDRAYRHGVRLASDMVPNHMGIDSEWVVEHPDWFIHRWESPFPAYSFNGPDLSNDSRVEIKIEDHYYDQTDAAVAFRLRHHHDGTTRYVYHGNDGTSFAWNDTAQLDYSKAEVREQVIQTILHVARQFPIIRFDAAMVLAKRHVQRLWFPLPGAGGSIPSRAENAMSQEEFDALMPHEFWREVVDRVATEVPGTLLLAEAFWLLEAYFVRTLGMHRVYNSAFMNMLRDEENAKYRSYIKKTIEFDPDVMKRYVNFMSNPDERTAIDQFGTGDKYFGVCTLLATLPGLPMFGHGQIEGFTERYGMEFKRARMDEHPNDWLIERHQREIAPLLKNRRLFAESYNFVLYDFWNDHGTVDENVFAYSNRLGDQRGLIVYNNTYGSTRGTIHISAAFMDKGSGELKQRNLADGLGVAYDDSLIFAYRDTAHGLEYLRRATDIHHHGLSFNLRGFQCSVFLNWRELRSSAEYPWDRLCDALHGDGVYSVDEALTRLRLQPLHDALHQAINSGSACSFAEVAVKQARKYSDRLGRDKHARVPKGASINLPDERAILDSRLHPFIENAQRFFDKSVEIMPAEEREGLKASTVSAAENGSASDLGYDFRKEYEAWATAALHLPLLEQAFSTAWPASVRYMLPSNEHGISIEQTWSPVLAWILLRSFPPQGMTAALFDKLMLRAALAETFSSLGLEGDRAWQASARVRVLLAHADLSADALIQSKAFWEDPDVRWLTGVHESGGTSYFNKEQFEELLSWSQLPALLEIARHDAFKPSAIEKIEDGIAKACLAASDAGYKLDTYLELLASEKVLQK